jgi:3-deoxy-D-manno-octulosonic-acid transferase
MRMRRRGGYGHHFSHRFGLHSNSINWPIGKSRIWLQAVSVGEVLAVAPLLEVLSKQGVSVYLTTTTSTGFKLANDKYKHLCVGIGYFPIDFILFSQVGWNRINPDLSILTEGERWPEHLAQAKKREVPVININARLSDKSFSRLSSLKKFLPSVVGLMLNDLTYILPVSKRDEEHFKSLGVDQKRLITTGNIKLDVSINSETSEAKEVLRKELGLNSGVILLGSSTWPGEEELLIEALKYLRAHGIACSLLLVPRHAERRDEIKKLLQQSGLRYHIRTSGLAIAPVDVALADTTGELRRLTQLAEIVFIGKSTSPHTEGQTPVEAAALAKPMIVGPGMANFKTIVSELVQLNAVVQLKTSDQLSNTLLSILKDEGKQHALASNAYSWYSQNGGAVERTIKVILQNLKDRSQVS